MYQAVAILRQMLNIKNLYRGLVLIFVIMCYWWFFWRVYELSTGLITWEQLVTINRQFYLFILGGIVTIPSIFIWRKIILG